MIRLRAARFGETGWLRAARCGETGWRRAPRCGETASRRGPRFGVAGLALLTAIAVVAGGSTGLLACPNCFGAEEKSMIDGTRLGIVAMLAVTFAVQGGFLGFFLYLRKRAKRIADVELDSEWSELQRASKTS